MTDETRVAMYGSLLVARPGALRTLTNEIGRVIEYRGPAPFYLTPPAPPRATDWRCAYCAGLRAAAARDCEGCGAPRT